MVIGSAQARDQFAARPIGKQPTGTFSAYHLMEPPLAFLVMGAGTPEEKRP
jgi:hypothetical protein